MSTITADQYDEVTKLAQGAARRVAASWPDAVEADDLAQEILMRLVESPGALEKVFVEDEPTRKAFLIKVGHQVASELFQDYEQFSGNYTYDVPAVRGLLDRDALLSTPEQWTPEVMDLREAMNNLHVAKSAYFDVLVNRYVHELPDTYTPNGRKRVERGVEALTAQMNRIGAERRKNYTEGPGTRKAMSNAASTRILSTQDA